MAFPSSDPSFSVCSLQEQCNPTSGMKLSGRSFCWTKMGQMSIPVTWTRSDSDQPKHVSTDLRIRQTLSELRGPSSRAIAAIQHVRRVGDRVGNERLCPLRKEELQQVMLEVESLFFCLATYQHGFRTEMLCFTSSTGSRLT